MAEHQGRSGDDSPSTPVAFHFKIAWTSLYANLPDTTRSRALVKTDGSLLGNRAPAKPGAAWSMVVPKMQRPQRARVLEIRSPPRKALPPASKVVEAHELVAFFAPAAALAACLVLLLFQFVPKNRMTVVHPSALPRAIYHPAQPDVLRDVPAAAPVEAGPEASLRGHAEPQPVQLAEPAPVIAEPPRVKELPKTPAFVPANVPGVALSQTAAYRPQAIPEPVLTQGFESSRVLKKVKPIYPELATAERVQGTVRLKATINKDGTVARVVPESGPAMLYDAASSAVRQWTFLPARLNGDPVEDVIHVNIGFAIVAPGQQIQR